MRVPPEKRKDNPPDRGLAAKKLPERREANYWWVGGGRMYGIRNGADGEGLSSGNWILPEITERTGAFAALELRSAACA